MGGLEQDSTGIQVYNTCQIQKCLPGHTVTRQGNFLVRPDRAILRVELISGVALSPKLDLDPEGRKRRG